MILVVIGHINYANTGIKEWIYSFHMPAFFFVSGMMTNLSSYDNNPKLFICKHINRLVVPFFLWALVFAKFSWPNIAKISYGSYYCISHAGALTSLWFLPVLFVSILLMYLIHRCHISNLNRVFIIIATFAIGFIIPHVKIGYPWSLNVAFVALGFMLLGHLLKTLIFDTRMFIVNKGKTGLIFCFVFLLVCFAFTFVYIFNNIDKGTVLMGNARYGNSLLFLLSSFSGILLTMFFSIFIDSILNGRDVRILSFIGQNTLCIFAIQKPFIQLFRPFFQGVSMPDIVVLFIVTIFTLVLTCICSLFFNKYLPVFVGKQTLI